jgi:hypothetical protein
MRCNHSSSWLLQQGKETELEIALYDELADKLTIILSDGPTIDNPLEG